MENEARYSKCGFGFGCYIHAQSGYGTVLCTLKYPGMSNEAQWLYPATFNTSTVPTTRLQSRDIHRCAAISSHLTSYITTPHKRVIYIMTLHGEFCGTALSDGPSHQITQGTLGPITSRNDICQGTNVGGSTIAFIPAIKKCVMSANKLWFMCQAAMDNAHQRAILFQLPLSYLDCNSEVFYQSKTEEAPQSSEHDWMI